MKMVLVRTLPALTIMLYNCITQVSVRQTFPKQTLKAPKAGGDIHRFRTFSGQNTLFVGHATACPHRRSGGTSPRQHLRLRTGEDLSTDVPEHIL
jgi:hypothetical protein